MSSEAVPSGRIVNFPADFFSRPSVVKLIHEWERAVEWWMFIVLIGREVVIEGRLMAGGQPLELEDLRCLHRNEIPLEYLQALLNYGMLVEDPRGGYRINRWSQDWYRCASKMPEAQTAYKSQYREAQRAKSDESEAVRSCPKPSEFVRRTTINHQPSTNNHQPSTINHQPEPICPKIDSDKIFDDDDSSLSLNDDGTETGLDLASATQDALEAAAGLEFSSGSSYNGFARKLQERIAASSEPLAMAWACRAAIIHTLHQQAHGGKEIGNPCGYALDIAGKHLESALQQIEANRIRSAGGLPATPYVWRPPKATAEANPPPSQSPSPLQRDKARRKETAHAGA